MVAQPIAPEPRHRGLQLHLRTPLAEHALQHRVVGVVAAAARVAPPRVLDRLRRYQLGDGRTQPAFRLARGVQQLAPPRARQTSARPSSRPIASSGPGRSIA